MPLQTTRVVKSRGGHTQDIIAFKNMKLGSEPADNKSIMPAFKTVNFASNKLEVVFGGCCQFNSGFVGSRLVPDSINDFSADLTSYLSTNPFPIKMYSQIIIKREKYK